MHRLPDNLPYADAAMLEAVAVALHAVSLVPVAHGQYGALSSEQERSDCSCSKLSASQDVRAYLVTDIDPTRLKLSHELGATETLSGQ